MQVGNFARIKMSQMTPFRVFFFLWNIVEAIIVMEQGNLLSS